MQHRGQEATGSSSSDSNIRTIKNRGLVTSVFNEESFKILKGDIAIGHNRYSTAGKDSILDAQPIYAKYKLGEISIAHNGNLINKQETRDELIEDGAIFQTSMDTENIIHLISRQKDTGLSKRIENAVKTIKGAYSLVILSRSEMFVIRDRYGIRPLSLGKLPDGGYIVASETCAFDLVGATFIRDVKPGELLIFEKNKPPVSMQIFEATPHHCIFEYVYFARPDSTVFGKNVYKLRKEMGRTLAKEAPVKADMVIPVPDGGVPAALGYSEESGIPFNMAIMRNHYVGRTFIEPTQKIRNLKVKMKLSPISEVVKGKKIIVIDDSIVRGTTSRQIIRMLKEAGAKEVHMRISSPPTTHPCYYGVDTPDQNQLIASNYTISEIANFIEADSLAYLSNDGLLNSVGRDLNYCKTCFDGNFIIKPETKIQKK